MGRKTAIWVLYCVIAAAPGRTADDVTLTSFYPSPEGEYNTVTTETASLASAGGRFVAGADIDALSASTMNQVKNLIMAEGSVTQPTGTPIQNPLKIIDRDGQELMSMNERGEMRLPQGSGDIYLGRVNQWVSNLSGSGFRPEDVYIVRSPASDWTTASVQCDAGDSLLSGGCQMEDNSNTSDNQSDFISRPSQRVNGKHSGWTCGTSSNNLVIYAYAVCYDSNGNLSDSRNARYIQR